MTSEVRLYRGEIWHCAGSPSSFCSIPNGVLAVNQKGTLVDVGPSAAISSKYSGATVEDFGDSLLIPGFVDAHLHFPQLDLIGCYGETLLGWLDKYIFPGEMQFKESSIAQDVAVRLTTELIANGTTTAAIFSSNYPQATEILFRQLEKSGLRAIVGRVSMDRNAPAELLMNAEESRTADELLIDRWHGKDDRLYYALTPRFAPTCSEALLREISKIRQAHPTVYVQTHYAESLQEVEWVKSLFPKAKHYLDVYDQFDLLGPKTLLAHSLHFSTPELKRMQETNTAIVHCPTSNLFLGSGLFPWRQIREHDLRVALGSDVGAGPTFSLWKILLEAYQVQQLRGDPTTPSELFWSATLGGAQALGLEASIGNFEVGKSADFQVVDWKRSRLLAAQFHKRPTAEERLFAVICNGDDCLVSRVFIQGKEKLAQ